MALAAPGHAIFGGLVGIITGLVTALKAGDWPSIGKGIKDLFEYLFGDDGTGTFPNAAAMRAPVARGLFDVLKLVAWLKKIMDMLS